MEEWLMHGLADSHVLCMNMEEMMMSYVTLSVTRVR